MARNQKDEIFDTATQLKDAGAITADAPAQVGGANAILDLGLARVDARVVVDVSAIDVASGDELYNLRFQLSNSASFASGVIGGPILQLGDSTVLIGESADSLVGRYEMGVCNEVNGTLYRYARLYTDVGGTTPSINYTAYLVKKA